MDSGFKDQLVDRAHQLGFHAIGITSPSISKAILQAFENWLKDGKHASMHYMLRGADKRKDMSLILSDVKSVIVLAVNYHEKSAAKPGRNYGRVAQYAKSKDYHKVIEKKLKELSLWMQNHDPDCSTLYYVDTGPILEKVYAEKAGLGFIGKNTLLIHPMYGSWMFLSVILVNKTLPIDQPINDSCGECTLCIQACPTGALDTPYVLDARQCISYWTIEHKEDIPSQMHSKIGDWIFGCDICQNVCPYNQSIPVSDWVELLSASGTGQWILFDQVLDLDNEHYQEKFQWSPLKRSKLAGLKRNASIVKKNVESRRLSI